MIINKLYQMYLKRFICFYCFCAHVSCISFIPALWTLTTNSLQLKFMHRLFSNMCHILIYNATIQQTQHDFLISHNLNHWEKYAQTHNNFITVTTPECCSSITFDVSFCFAFYILHRFVRDLCSYCAAVLRNARVFFSMYTVYFFNITTMHVFFLVCIQYIFLISPPCTCFF